MRRKIILILLAAGMLFAVGCSLHSGSTYDRSEMGQPQHFSKGVILSVRDVEVKGTESGVGAVAGAAAGGLAGSMLGGSTTTKAIGAIGGAVVGGLAGAKGEEVVMSGSASEIIVQPDGGDPYSIIQVNDEELRVGERVLIFESGKTRIVRDQTGTP